MVEAEFLTSGSGLYSGAIDGGKRMCGVGIENGMSAFGAFVGVSWGKEDMKVLHGSC